MVSDITGIDYSILEDNVLLETNELPITRYNEKAKKCDFVLRIGENHIINLELNQRSYTGLIVKNLSYLFHLFSSSSKKGETYNDNLVVTQINLNCYKEDNDKPLKRYNLREDDTNKLYVKNIAIYDLNIVKCHEIYYNELKKENLPNYIKWGALIFSKELEDIPDILDSFLSKKEKNIIMASIDKLTHEDFFYTKEESLKWEEWERKTIEKEIKEQGITEGIEKGIEKGIEQGMEQKTKENILSMIENNLSLELISKVTNKSIEEINKIIKEQ